MIRKSIAIFMLLIAAELTAAIFYHPTKEDNSDAPFLVPTEVAVKEDIQIMFVGDLMLDRGIRYFANKNKSYEFIFDKIYPLLAESDLVVANLEGPITNEESVSYSTKPGETNNYFFTFDPSTAELLYKENIRLVNLGNNHILNFHTAGVESTKDYLSKANVEYFGAPEDKRSIIKEINGLKIAFVNYNEFYGDTDKENQAVIGEIKEVKVKSDLVFVFCHWGAEYDPEPTDIMKDLAHKFIDQGADLVLGSHAHVIGLKENYNGKNIYYSLGNFIFDQYFSENVRNGLGLLVEINPDNKKLTFEEIKLYLQSNGQTILVEKNSEK